MSNLTEPRAPYLNQRTNTDRAEEARTLCQQMEAMTGVDTLESQVADAMTHLMHLCRLIKDEEGDDINFESCLVTARMNFEAEVLEDPDN